MNENDIGRFALRLPRDFAKQEVVAATWGMAGVSQVDYLLYVPAANVPEGGAWIDVIHATNLENMIAADATKPDDVLVGFAVLGYFNLQGQFQQDAEPWGIEDVGGGNLYVTWSDRDPEHVAAGLIVRIARRAAKESELEPIDLIAVASGRLTMQERSDARRFSEYTAAVTSQPPEQIYESKYLQLKRRVTMQAVVGVTLAKAKELTRGEYNALRGWTVPADENPDDKGFLIDTFGLPSNNVAGCDGYATWLPAAQYEVTYRPTTGIDFGRALELLKSGIPMARVGWNGKDMFVYWVPAGEYPARTRVAQQYYGDALVPYNPYFAIKNVDGTVSTWVPSVNDIASEDWYTANLAKPQE